MIKEGYLWFPSELPQSLAHFPMFISHFLLCGFTAALSFLSLSLCAILSLLSFVLFCFVCYSNLFLFLLVVDSYWNQYLCMCVCGLTIKILYSLSLSFCLYYVAASVVYSICFSPVRQPQHWAEDHLWLQVNEIIQAEHQIPVLRPESASLNSLKSAVVATEHILLMHSSLYRTINALLKT